MSSLINVMPCKHHVVALGSRYIQDIVNNIPVTVNEMPSPCYQFLTMLVKRVHAFNGYIFERLMLLKVSESEILCLENNKLVLKINIKNLTVISKLDFINAVLKTECGSIPIETIVKEMDVPSTQNQPITGHHDFLMNLERNGLVAKYCVEVLWAKEINSIVRLTLDKTIVVQGDALRLTNMDLTNKHCQQVYGFGQLPDFLKSCEPWFVLTQDLFNKIDCGILTFEVNELRQPHFSGWPSPEGLLEHLRVLWGAAKNIGARTLVLTKKFLFKTDGGHIEAVLFDDFDRKITETEIHGLLTPKFKSSAEYKRFKRQLYKAFKTYLELGDCYIVTPTVLKINLSQSELCDEQLKGAEKMETTEEKTVVKPEMVNVLGSHPLVKTVKQIVDQNIQDQDKHVALVNCFYTWDGLCDKDVISQGIFDRYKALNKPLTSICIQRKDLHNITIIGFLESTDDPVELFNLRRGPYLTGSTVHDTNFFHPEELEFMEDWLFENFYH